MRAHAWTTYTVPARSGGAANDSPCSGSYATAAAGRPRTANESAYRCRTAPGGRAASPAPAPAPAAAVAAPPGPRSTAATSTPPAPDVTPAASVSPPDAILYGTDGGRPRRDSSASPGDTCRAESETAAAGPSRWARTYAPPSPAPGAGRTASNRPYAGAPDRTASDSAIGTSSYMDGSTPAGRIRQPAGPFRCGELPDCIDRPTISPYSPPPPGPYSIRADAGMSGSPLWPVAGSGRLLLAAADAPCDARPRRPAGTDGTSHQYEAENSARPDGGQGESNREWDGPAACPLHTSNPLPAEYACEARPYGEEPTNSSAPPDADPDRNRAEPASYAASSSRTRPGPRRCSPCPSRETDGDPSRSRFEAYGSGEGADPAPPPPPPPPPSASEPPGPREYEYEPDRDGTAAALDGSPPSTTPAKPSAPPPAST